MENLKARIVEIMKDHDYPVYTCEWRVDRANSIPGNLKGLDCPKCLNRGYIAFLKDGQDFVRECECMSIRRSLKMIEESGLSETLKECTFDSFEVRNTWQKSVKNSAQRFISDCGKWFYIGGNSGSGKTHICTAICGAFLRKNRSVRYMVWATDIRRLKAAVNDEEYDRIFNKYANADVLYIDDLFKVKAGAELSPSDVQRTYELINYRYMHKDRPTIISSEKSVDDILTIDEAIGGRIYSMAKEYNVVLGHDAKKNWRLNGG